MLYKVKYYLKLKISKYAIVYLTLYRIENILTSIFTQKYRDRYSSSVVSRSTSLVIEGYPRCANSFSTRAFFFSDKNKDHDVAHHVHSSAQIIYAVNRKIPAIILIRKPIDAVVSYLIRNGSITPDMALHGYISFYKDVIFCRDSCIVAKFDDVVNDFGSIIKQVNSKYGVNFDIFTHTEASRKEIFSATNRRSAKYKLSPDKPLGNNSDDKKKLTKEYENLIYSKSSLMSLIQEANDLYDQFTTG